MFKSLRKVGRVLYVQFSRDDQNVMSSGDGGVNIWDVKSCFVRNQEMDRGNGID